MSNDNELNEIKEQLGQLIELMQQNVNRVPIPAQPTSLTAMQTEPLTLEQRIDAYIEASPWQTQNERKFLRAYGNSLGNIPAASAAVGLHRSWCHGKCKSYPKFKKALEDIDALYTGEIENHLLDGSRAGKVRASQILLKSRDPRYRDKGDVNINNNLAQYNDTSFNPNQSLEESARRLKELLPMVMAMQHGTDVEAECKRDGTEPIEIPAELFINDPEYLRLTGQTPVDPERSEADVSSDEESEDHDD